MTIILPLDPQKEAKLNAVAKAKGITPGELVTQAIHQIIAEAPDSANSELTRSLRGLLAKYCPAPSAEEIDRNRTEMFQNFPRADI